MLATLIDLETCRTRDDPDEHRTRAVLRFRSMLAAEARSHRNRFLHARFRGKAYQVD